MGENENGPYEGDSILDEFWSKVGRNNNEYFKKKSIIIYSTAHTFVCIKTETLEYLLYPGKQLTIFPS